jgi:multidrug efflux pump subunit AcrB
MAQQQSFRELLMVFALAIVIFTILVIQFRAWIPAILILLAAPLSLGGALCCCCCPIVTRTSSAMD